MNAPKAVINSKYGTARSTAAEVAAANFVAASRKKEPDTRTWANGGFNGTIQQALDCTDHPKPLGMTNADTVKLWDRHEVMRLPIDTETVIK